MNAGYSDQTTKDSILTEVLAFALGSEEYGVDILKVQEIRDCGGITAIANVPAFIKGVTNIRGQMVPIIDLRTRFELAEAKYDEKTVMIVLNIADRVVGIVVDSVSDVLSLDPERVKPSPDLGDAVATGYLQGFASLENRMLILLDVDKLLSNNELLLANTIDAEIC